MNHFLVQQLLGQIMSIKQLLHVIACIWDVFATPTDTPKSLGAGTMSVHIFFFQYLFIWLHRVLAVARKTFSLYCGRKDL